MPFTRITATWNGVGGLPGYSRFRFNGELTTAEATAAASRVRAFFNSILALLPAQVNITWDGVAQIYGVDQVQTGVVSYTPPALVQGTSINTFSAPTGAVINWLTGFFHNGRQVRGRTFLVPLGGNAFQTDGTLATAAQGTIVSAAATLLGGGPPLVVSGGGPPGEFIQVEITGASVPDKGAVLRSRRD